MKRIIIFIFCGLTISAFAQQKEPIYSIVEELHDKEWYENQLKLWGDEATKGSKSPDAWYNYYAASRALLNLTTGEERTKYKELGKTITKEVLEMHPSSFEANYVAMWSGGLGSDKYEEYLWKAHEMRPNDPLLYDELLINYAIKRKEKELKEMSQTMLQTNYLAGGVLNWGYNVLSEVQENGIVLTSGDNDTYALWINQSGLNHRKDVTILNINLLFLTEYRELHFNMLGIEAANAEGFSMTDMITHVMKNKKGIPVHITSTALHSFENPAVDSHLYLTGLTYQYSAESLDNNSLIRRNFEQRFALDYLKVKFTSHRMDEIASSFNATYLAAMVKLYKMYETSGESDKMKELAVLMEKASENGDMAEEIQKIIH